MNITTRRDFLKFTALGTVACAAEQLLPAASTQPATTLAADIFELNRKLGRGVNIIGYDPLWKSRRQARFQDKHFRLLKQAGFDSVRVNLHPFRHMQGEKMELPQTWWDTLDWVVKQGTEQGLRVVLDCHEFNAMGADAEGNHEKFLAFWRQLAPHCKNASEQVLLEILNEPNKKMTPELWNQYLAEALVIIRETNPTRPVVVGPAFWNSIDHLKELQLPEKDRNLIVTVHYYKPMEFTHQGASWGSHKDKSGIEWTATDKQRQAVQDDFAKVVAWAKENDRPIYLGEFGAFDKAPMASRVCYTDYVARSAEALGWSWAYWQFDNDFLLWDMSRDAWVEPILHALIPRKQ